MTNKVWLMIKISHIYIYIYIGFISQSNNSRELKRSGVGKFQLHSQVFPAILLDSFSKYSRQQKFGYLEYLLNTSSVESQGWGCTESDMTEVTSQQQCRNMFNVRYAKKMTCVPVFLLRRECIMTVIQMNNNTSEKCFIDC